MAPRQEAFARENASGGSHSLGTCDGPFRCHCRNRMNWTRWTLIQSCSLPPAETYGRYSTLNMGYYSLFP